VPHDDRSISEWSDNELHQTALRKRGVGVNAGLPAAVRFVASVVKLIGKRVKYGEEVDPAVFFLSPKPPSELDQLEHVPMLDNGFTPVGGAFWFVSPVARRGFAWRGTDMQDDGGVFECAEQLGLGGVPALYFETRSDPPIARHYPAGLSQPDDMEPVRLLGESISLDEVFMQIDLVHQTLLVRPKAGGGAPVLWEKPTKYWPIKHAEYKIQAEVRRMLVSRYPGCDVREELPQVTGRVDLQIEEPHPDLDGQFIRHALLELKVLRSFGSTGTPVSPAAVAQAVKEGLDQAAAYRIENRALAAALCCFDMRKSYSETECFEHVVGDAARNDVKLRVWHLFNSVGTYQAAVAQIGEQPHGCGP